MCITYSAEEDGCLGQSGVWWDERKDLRGEGRIFIYKITQINQNIPTNVILCVQREVVWDNLMFDRMGEILEGDVCKYLPANIWNYRVKLACRTIQDVYPNILILIPIPIDTSHSTEAGC